MLLLRGYLAPLSCSPPNSTRLIVNCQNVCSLPEDIITVPKEVEALCLSGDIKVLEAQTFQAFPELHYLRLMIKKDVVISPRAFIDLNKLQYLFIVFQNLQSCSKLIDICETFFPMPSLQTLVLSDVSPTGGDITLSHQLQLLSVSRCSLKHVLELLHFFLSLKSSPQGSVNQLMPDSFSSSLSQKQHPSSLAPAVPTSWSQKEGKSPEGQNRCFLQNLRWSFPPLTLGNFGCYCSNAWFVSWASGKKDLFVSIVHPLRCQQLTTALKSQKFLQFVEHNCILKIDFILFMATSSLILFLMSFLLIHVTCGSELFFLIYILRGWWHRLCGEIGKGKRFEYDAFVSYCRQDQNWVLQNLVPNLERNGPPFLKLCLHSRDFVVGKAIVDNIMDNLYRSRKAICVISPHSLCNHWCSLELSLATYRLLAEPDDTLILVFLERRSRYQLSSYYRLAKLVKKKTYIDWPEKPTAQLVFWDRLRKSLKQPCGDEEGAI
ncbi:toll-like receptor 13 [Podarcis lilfordi]|uniref:Toll-like receptor 13 n=1 Tax=Podarcis lilfordi TaxID=74358 RepID=A0AA35PMV3_9SAUR|nr:toll-like receptor 13 [Podarcis lilfordi]